jgi:hypothetical protein
VFLWLQPSVFLWLEPSVFLWLEPSALAPGFLFRTAFSQTVSFATAPFDLEKPPARRRRRVWSGPVLSVSQEELGSQQQKSLRDSVCLKPRLAVE